MRNNLKNNITFLLGWSLAVSLLGCSAEDTIDLRDEGNIETNAVGRAELGPEDNLNNIPVDVLLFNLPEPSDLDPKGTQYVVWSKLPDGTAHLLGKVYIQNHITGEGRLLTTTTDRVFKLLVTIEKDHIPATPSDRILLESEPFSSK